MENQLKEYESKALQALEYYASIKEQQEKLAEQEKEIREQLLIVMMENGVSQVKNEKYTISVVYGSTTITIDTKALEKTEPELYNELVKKYKKTTTRKDSLRIVAKEK